MKHRGVKFLSLLLTLAMVVGLMPGMGLTAYAAPTETLLTTITGAGSNAPTATSANVSYSTEGVATLTFSGSVSYQASPAWGWWGYGWTATVNAAEGYTITKCVFYDDANRTATDSSSPFVVETTEEDKTPRINGTPIDGGKSQSKGLKKIEVYGYATPAHTHSFSYAAGTGDSANTITATCTAGCPDSYDTNGISLIISAPSNLVCDDSAKAATLSGYPSTAPTGLAAAPTSISYNPGGTAPTTPGTYTASFTWGGATASVSFTLTANAFTVTYDANGGSGEMKPTKVSKNDEGKYIYKVESCGFTAPEGEAFAYWLGSDGKTYRPGPEVEISANLTLTAQWKKSGSDGGDSDGGGSGFDLVFNIPGADNSWEYVGGYVAPQQAYRVSLAPMQGGSAALGLTTGESGVQMNVYPTTTIYVFPNANPGFVLDKIVWSLIDGSASYDITEAKNFVMPAMDVVVYVTFQPLAS